MKYNSTAVLQWADILDGVGHTTDLCRDVLVRGSGLYAGGLRSRAVLDTSALLIKYEP